MAWVEAKKRADGGTSCTVRWRLGGARGGCSQNETFGAGSDAQNAARADGFKRMVEAAGSRWPEGWVKGEGFVRVHNDEPATETEARRFEDLGLEYVGQIVACSPGQRKRYKSQVRVRSDVEVRGPFGMYRPFGGLVGAVTEDDVKAWLIGWDRSMKTKANYHGLLTGVFTYALERTLVTQIPTLRTAPKKRQIKQSQSDLRFLTESEFAIAARAAGNDGDLLRVAAGTGVRYGEVTALWVSDVDLKHKTIRINKAWKREGDDGAQEVPGWLRKMLCPKHVMSGHYLGNPKTPKSRRTIEISDKLAAILERCVEGRAADDFVFVKPNDAPLHQSDFYVRVWMPLMRAIAEKGIASFRFHDLRHTHVAWLIAGGAPLPHIQARLGHESITTTIDTYGHLLPLGDGLISYIVDTALDGNEIQARPSMRLIAGGKTEAESARPASSAAPGESLYP